ncbi:MAG TPA: diacylglycerol kinase family protein [Bacillota bacterium]|nr:diacylglycerol kinase family protein [Bacillota bacterium]HPZ21534.1 diacylglycerol kinase family protein [Bacillota bacterium]HQD19599.1 diacylglycerol kinase family protein [Bacillota bacterium]
MRAKTLWESFRFAFQGFAYSFKTQRNFRVHCLAAVVLAILIAVLGFEPYEIMFLLSAAFFVLCSELFNTAIEKTIDLYTDKYHPLAKIAKNCAAAAVLLAALYAVIVGVLVLFPKILELIRG